jgi:hypothetical protein
MHHVKSCSFAQARGPAAALALAALLMSTAPAGAENLVTNPGFEQEIQGWFAFGPATFTAPTTLPHSGQRSAYVTDRTDTWNGVGQSMLDTLLPGGEYFVSAWVRLDNAASDTVRVTIR